MCCEHHERPTCNVPERQVGLRMGMRVCAAVSMLMAAGRVRKPRCNTWATRWATRWAARRVARRVSPCCHVRPQCYHTMLPCQATMLSHHSARAPCNATMPCHAMPCRHTVSLSPHITAHTSSTLVDGIGSATSRSCTRAGH